MQDNKIQYGISEIALKDAVEDFSESLEEILSDPVAEGDEPNSGKGDVYAFSPLVYPSNLKPVAEKILALNKPPQIFDTISTIVKKGQKGQR